LILELLSALRLRLLLVNVLHEYTLILKHVTLDLHVKQMVEMLIELLVVAILLQKTAQNTHAAHPKDFLRHTGISRTKTLADTTMPALATLFGIAPAAESRVDGNWLANDQAVLDELADCLPRVGIGDLVCFVGIKPNLVTSALEHSGRKTLLENQVTHTLLVAPPRQPTMGVINSLVRTRNRRKQEASEHPLFD